MQCHSAICSITLLTTTDILRGIEQQSTVTSTDKNSIFRQLPYAGRVTCCTVYTDFSQLYFSLAIRHDQSKKFITRVYGVTSVYASLSVPASINSRVTGERIFRHKTAQKTNSRGLKGFYVARKL